MRKLILGTGASLLAAGLTTSALALPVSDAGKVTLHETDTNNLAGKRHGPKVRDKEVSTRTVSASGDIKDAEIKAAAIKHSDIKGADLKHSDMKEAEFKHTDLKHADIKGGDFKHSDIKSADMKLSDHKGGAPKPVEQRIK